MRRPERETTSEGAAWQGYANRDTWAVVLNLSNDYDAYHPFMADRVSRTRVGWPEVAEALAELGGGS